MNENSICKHVDAKEGFGWIPSGLPYFLLA